MKSILLILIPIFLALPGRTAGLQETWVYLYKGEETAFPSNSPITDIACFSAEINSEGALTGGHTSPPRLSGVRRGTRFHLVVTIPWNNALTHLYLNPELPLRDRIIRAIVQRSAPFDGVQIDIEAIDKNDRTAYLNFLATLKKALAPAKCFSVAVLSRWSSFVAQNPDDPFIYPGISRLADRIVVMAYDEHFRGGAPGAIASLPWCEKIVEYAKTTIEPDKLIMGIPLYGRGWQIAPLSRAYKNSEIRQELATKKIRPTEDSTDGGSYIFTQTVTVAVHYETLSSINAKLKLYATSSVRGVALWRIGQEPAGVWNTLKSYK